MTRPLFFQAERALSIAEIVAMTGAELPSGGRSDGLVSNVAALDRAGPDDLVFFDTATYRDQLRHCEAAACLVAEPLAAEVPERIIPLRSRDPYRAFVTVAQALYPQAMRPSSLFAATGIAVEATVHPSARVETDVTIDPGAIIGPEADIGGGTLIGANTVIGPQVRIGRDCVVGSGATVTNALVGDRVIIHAGCRIGQDGFGYQGGPRGHDKIPQIGRVIIQDEVEIGAGTTIDRGALRDTIIGEGTKIDNLVQIGHNVLIGRHCIIVAQSGISGSVTLEDWVVLGGQVGIADHLTIGEGAQIGASSGVMNDIPPGARWFGTPAKPAREQFRELSALRRIALRARNAGDRSKTGRTP